MDTNIYRWFGPELDDISSKKLKKFLPKRLFNSLIASDFSKTDKLQIFLKNYWEVNNKKIEKAISTMKGVWNKEGQSIVDDLKGLYGVKIKCKSITAFLTTLTIFPYNDEECWYAVSAFALEDELLSTTKHELAHFYFHRRFDSKKSGLSKDDYFKIKESFTVLTLPKEEGYSGHEELRNHIQKLKKKERILNRFLKVVWSLLAIKKLLQAEASSFLAIFFLAGSLVSYLNICSSTGFIDLNLTALLISG